MSLSKINRAGFQYAANPNITTNANSGGSSNNAAPNYTGYREKATEYQLNPQPSIDLAQRVNRAQVGVEQFCGTNQTPIINAQTLWANPNVVKSVQGMQALQKNGSGRT